MNRRFSSFSQHLLTWYRAHKRDLPWRRTVDPYRIWISETLLQQTQVATVIPYYERFIARFPTVEDLAAAPLDDVLKTWEGAGYYARARNLHRAAQQIVNEHGGCIPDTVDELLKLPGVGRYTAGAVASIAFGRDAPVLDGNVMRVLCRYEGIREDIQSGATRERLWTLAAKVLPPGQAGDWNQALMEHGATLCTPRNPQCNICPVRRGCVARREGLTAQIPFKRPKKANPHYIIGVGVIWRRGRILIQRRKEEGLLGGLWEFPGGKLEPDEALSACVRREAQEELGIEVHVGEELAVVDHSYTHFSITMHAFTCRHVRGRPRPHSATALKWVRPDELAQYAFPAANRKIIARLAQERAPR